MAKYASNTSVPVDRSMGQIRKILSDHGADGVAIAETKEGSSTQFVFEGKQYKLVIYYPSGVEDYILYTNSGRERTDDQIEKEMAAEKRRLWRAMVLYIKAAIEAHQNGLVDLKRSFMPYMVLPSGETVSQRLEGSVNQIDSNPRLLLE